MSIHPGETYFPVASISVRPRAGTWPIFTKRPWAIATSAAIHGFPAPSSTRPFRITTSYIVSAAVGRPRGASRATSPPAARTGAGPGADDGLGPALEHAAAAETARRNATVVPEASV